MTRVNVALKFFLVFLTTSTTILTATAAWEFLTDREIRYKEPEKERVGSLNFFLAKNSSAQQGKISKNLNDGGVIDIVGIVGNELEDGGRDQVKVSKFYFPGKPRKPSQAKVWAYGTGCCTAVIIFARMGGVIVLPLLRADLYEKVIITMVGLAAGTLTGSSIFHLLPKAFSLEETYEREKYIGRCILIVGGVWAFLMIERLLNLIFHYKERRMRYGRQWRLDNVLALPLRPEQSQVSIISLEKNGQKYRTGNFKPDKSQSSQKDEEENQKQNDLKGSNDSGEGRAGDKITVKSCLTCLGQREDKLRLRGPDKYRLTSNTLDSILFQEGTFSQISTEAWLIIASDCFLDFVDGLAIGAAFHESILTGCSIGLGVLLDELPHELGEFAILVNAGLPFRQALLLKFAASTTTYLGLCVGIWLGSVDAGSYVFAMAAGMFLYIALVDMIPELNEAALKSSKASMFKGVRELLLQNLGLLMGISSIYAMTMNEDVFDAL